jgi:hypothetical protein
VGQQEDAVDIKQQVRSRRDLSERVVAAYGALGESSRREFSEGVVGVGRACKQVQDP